MPVSLGLVNATEFNFTLGQNVSGSLFGELFQGTNIAGLDWIIALPALMIALVLVTRDPHEWATLAFPMAMVFQIMGLTVNPFLFIILGVVFVINTLSLRVLGNTISGGVDFVSNVWDSGSGAYRASKESARKEEELWAKRAGETLAKEGKWTMEGQASQYPYLVKDRDGNTRLAMKGAGPKSIQERQEGMDARVKKAYESKGYSLKPIESTKGSRARVVSNEVERDVVAARRKRIRRFMETF